ncbi:MAG: hypothetical protein ACI9IA_000224 [Enterobacterales bacterium]|jgi:hypothetical protein
MRRYLIIALTLLSTVAIAQFTSNIVKQIDEINSKADLILTPVNKVVITGIVDGSILYNDSGLTGLAIGTLDQLLTVGASGFPIWMDAPISTTLTTKGDVQTYDSANARLAVGTDAQILSADSTETTGLKWIDLPISTTLNTKGQIQTYTTVNANLNVGTNGTFLVADSNEATGLKWSDSISGAINPITEWVAFPMVIDAVTTAPTKATTTIADEAQWRRVGGSMEITYYYLHTDNTGAVSGSGNYLYNLPIGYQIDLTRVIENSSVDHTGSLIGHGFSAPGVLNNTGQSNEVGTMTVYDADSIRLANYIGSTRVSLFQGSGHNPITSATIQYSFRVTVPIVGWGAGVDINAIPAKLLTVRAEGNAGQVLTANVTNASWIETEDNSNSFDGVTFTCPNTSDYHFSGLLSATTDTNSSIYLYRDAVKSVQVSPSGINTNGKKLDAIIKCNSVGEAFTFRMTATQTLNNITTDHYLTIKEVKDDNIFLGRVTTSSDSTIRVENCDLGTGTIVTDASGLCANWVDSVTTVTCGSGGNCKQINFKAGTFSQKPVCTGICSDGACYNTSLPFIIIQEGSTTTEVVMAIARSDSQTPKWDTVMDITCTGKR